MLRSMLYVRYGSGWRRRVTASAARPRRGRPVLSNSATPSPKLSLSPATARSRILVTESTAESRAGSNGGRRLVELDVDARAGQADFAGEHVKVMQSRQGTRAEIEADDVAEIAPA